MMHFLLLGWVANATADVSRCLLYYNYIDDSMYSANGWMLVHALTAIMPIPLTFYLLPTLVATPPARYLFRLACMTITLRQRSGTAPGNRRRATILEAGGRVMTTGCR